MWQWSSTVAEYAEAAAFTRRQREPELSFTDAGCGFAVTVPSDGADIGEVCEAEESNDADDPRAPRRSLPRCPGYDLVG